MMLSNKVKLFKLTSNHNNLRTDVIEGISESLPEVGKGFILYGEGLEFGLRVIYTTPIQEIYQTEDQKSFLFKTQNSTYALLVEEKLECAEI